MTSPLPAGKPISIESHAEDLLGLRKMREDLWEEPGRWVQKPLGTDWSVGRGPVCLHPDFFLLLPSNRVQSGPAMALSCVAVMPLGQR